LENIDHIAKNSLDSIARNNLSDEGKRHITIDVITGAVGIVSLIVGLIISKVYPDRPAVAALIYTIGIIIETAPIYVEAVSGIIGKNLTRSMEILVAIAVTACFFSGELITAILIPLILNAAHILEERSIMGGRQAIEGLKRMQQTVAHRLSEDGSFTDVKASTLLPGDLILIRPGDGIPTDGTVTDGASSVDQKSLTGEPEPVLASAGSKVYAGTLNIDGTLKVKVDKQYTDTSFSNIIKLLEQSEKMDIPESRLIDRFMKYYIPFILSIAAAVALVNNDISRAVAILVVSCPCGQMLVSSAPMVAALSAATKRGILIKNSKFIEKISSADAVIFDKTGTLTTGQMSLCGISVKDDAISKETVTGICYSLCRMSTHPVSAAVTAYAEGLPTEAMLSGTPVNDIKEIPGIGMSGYIGSTGSPDGYFAGGEYVAFGRIDREKYESFAEIFPEIKDAKGSVSLLTKGSDNTPVAALFFDDTVRAGAKEALCALKDLGVKETVMLTGDRRSSAVRIGSEAGVDSIYAELLPADKLDKLNELKTRSEAVIAVGDGINDALILRDSDVGIAMGAMGSELAIQSADIALMNNRLENIPFIIKLSEKTRKVIYQNLIISILISAVMIVLSALGLITAVFGALFHNVGAFTVLINSSKILKTGNKDNIKEQNKDA